MQRFLIPLLFWVIAILPAMAGFRNVSPKMMQPAPPSVDKSWAKSAITLVRHPDGSIPQIVDVTIGSAGIGIAAATDRRILRTVDGGVQWSATRAVLVASGVALRDNVGLIVGRSGVIGRSTDAGITWKPVVNQILVPLTKVSFTNGNGAVAVGAGGIVQSDDQGETWKRVEAPIGHYYEVAFRGRLGIVVGGGGRIGRSTDDGVTWSSQLLAETNSLRGIAIVDDTTVVVVGSGGAIVRSVDSGVSWNRVSSGTRMHLRAVAFANPTDGVAVGLYGTAIRTFDGGASWRNEETGTRVHLTDVVTALGRTVAVGWFDTTITLGNDSSDRIKTR